MLSRSAFFSPKATRLLKNVPSAPPANRAMNAEISSVLTVRCRPFPSGRLPITVSLHARHRFNFTHEISCQNLTMCPLCSPGPESAQIVSPVESFIRTVRPVLQIHRMKIPNLSQPTLHDPLLGQRNCRDSTVIKSDRVTHTRGAGCFQHLRAPRQAVARREGNGFSQSTCFPASTAAVAMSA